MGLLSEVLIIIIIISIPTVALTGVGGKVCSKITKNRK